MSRAQPQLDYFDLFAPPIRPPSALRTRITESYRLPEPECVPPLALAARLDPAMQVKVAETAGALIIALRGKRRGSVVEELVQEYALSSQEGVALMCLAEALLRIPDNETRDALIRDKISDGNWASHLGGGRSLFVNAATWGLVVTGKLTAPVSENSLAGALTRLIARAGEPVIRRGVDMAMRMMGEQFVMGETIAEALERAREQEAQGFTYSYDMLGEAAMTAEDAARYLAAYEAAIHAIGRAAAGRGLYEGPGISIKLSALHPRYARSQSARVMGELLPRLTALARLAKSYNIGLNIDAEEADRLELSLDLIESLCSDPSLDGWDGIGFVVQAYGKRCPLVIDFLIDLARRTRHRIMIRLVKGAYWDAEIKRAQVDGLSGYPVYTRKPYSDVSYLACARKLLGAKDAVFPQFATHNAQSLAAIYHVAGPDFRVGDYEFQCLHGMGEPLYEEVVGAARLDRPCRIYAPVGTHETLLAYLVRRLLENGANSSFVNRIADEDVPVEALISDPVEMVLAMERPGAPHPAIRAPMDIYSNRTNSGGLDLSDETCLARLTEALKASIRTPWQAWHRDGYGLGRDVLNPADHRDKVGTVFDVSDAEARGAATRAAAAAAAWAETDVAERAACLRRSADALQQAMPTLLGLIMREAGKSAPNAIAEVREAIDFLRYYAVGAEKLEDAQPLGPIACISPWNFPLAIFTGQIAAALAAGNPVLAKPAEETPLIAAEAVRILHAAGVPADALQLLPGDGRIGAALVAAPEVQGVMFTGSTEVARLIQRTLANRISPEGRPIPLIAETGGQNAMIVDSSALAEQVVADVIASAFDSAGQRCSALRILCLQEEIADRTLSMLKGAMREVSVGPTSALSIDVGPVISAEARATIESHIAAMRARGCKVHQLPLPSACGHGTFVPPTIIEIGRIADVRREVFGPVLHVLRYRREDLDRLIDAINATGYGLTFGLHTRIDETIAHVTSRMAAGNIYVNRNVIGAVVGVQPFGGRGLSGTGPKAGGPLYLARLVKRAPPPQWPVRAEPDPAAQAFAAWMRADGKRMAPASTDAPPFGGGVLLEGPVGEENVYRLHPRGRIFLSPQTRAGLFRQLADVLATGNTAAIDVASGLVDDLADAPAIVRSRVEWVARPDDAGPLAGALVEGDSERVKTVLAGLAALDGAVIPAQAATTAELNETPSPYDARLLVEEIATSTNTTAAGGNASLMTIG
jgi:RHH-type proline utilization regulon transcriptional repressor/proline dehydrogenase/delta 1-pyrroline-5-carboxylate dehydrogenase